MPDTPADQTARPRGWYDDPDHPGTQRWWDGETWQREDFVPPRISRLDTDAVANAKSLGSRARTAGWLSLVFNPLFLTSVAAFVWGKRALRQGRDLPGQPGRKAARNGILLASVTVVIWLVALVVYIVLLAGGAGTTPPADNSVPPAAVFDGSTSG